MTDGMKEKRYNAPIRVAGTPTEIVADLLDGSPHSDWDTIGTRRLKADRLLASLRSRGWVLVPASEVRALRRQSL